LIINPVQLVATSAGTAESIDLSRSGMRGADVRAALEMPPTVMVVDDSLTVRKVTQRLLTREGYTVLLAKDGVDALRQLQEATPDVMLVDIEMPRMDGFDLTRNVRADPKLKHIPIVMITSRTADKHRNHAMSLGVNVFLGKPYGEDELLGHVSTLMAASRQGGGAGQEASAS
jgi:chemosensory pili system protein ChpA (sensor histidine kinase/response regulator)